jgi:hypothetical protein
VHLGGRLRLRARRRLHLGGRLWTRRLGLWRLRRPLRGRRRRTLLLLLLAPLEFLRRRRRSRRLRQLQRRLAGGDLDCDWRNKRRHHRAGEQELADFAHDFPRIPVMSIKADRAQRFRGPDGNRVAIAWPRMVDPRLRRRDIARFSLPAEAGARAPGCNLARSPPAGSRRCIDWRSGAFMAWQRTKVLGTLE